MAGSAQGQDSEAKQFKGALSQIFSIILNSQNIYLCCGNHSPDLLIYDYYDSALLRLVHTSDGSVVEIGSGIGNERSDLM